MSQMEMSLLRLNGQKLCDDTKLKSRTWSSGMEACSAARHQNWAGPAHSTLWTTGHCGSHLMHL
ncbi:hypothetical protein N7539_002878 [Penicillium diatomitis]|uniref:Uncharacterized protein n=1 Tax=Penicillium diatomitis TaxID=2819901 RepID=A0A9W9XFQ8_9EURO|nr:uncharacterized protein N7539_002878 [Penicillium diatomitis]KAJ5491311.1 hypothetical protein N7539_002878 [Penicillium diatomitis]